MNYGVVITDDMRVYYCSDCPYRDRVTGFCGFCMRKVLDDMPNIKSTRLPMQCAEPTGNEHGIRSM